MKNVNIVHLPQLFVFFQACFGKFHIFMSLLAVGSYCWDQIVNVVQTHQGDYGYRYCYCKLFFHLCIQFIHVPALPGYLLFISYKNMTMDSARLPYKPIYLTYEVGFKSNMNLFLWTIKLACYCPQRSQFYVWNRYLRRLT